MRVRIYRPARNAMQSGDARTKEWVLVFPQADEREIDPLMGWTSSDDTQSQVKLRFETQKQAEDYAKERGLDYVVLPPQTRKHNIRAQGYGDNFATNRRMPWTH